MSPLQLPLQNLQVQIGLVLSQLNNPQGQRNLQHQLQYLNQTLHSLQNNKFASQYQDSVYQLALMSNSYAIFEVGLIFSVYYFGFWFSKQFFKKNLISSFSFSRKVIRRIKSLENSIDSFLTMNNAQIPCFFCWLRFIFF